MKQKNIATARLFRYARKLLNVSVSDMSVKLNIHRSSLYRIELGEISPSLQLYNKLEVVTGSSLAELAKQASCAMV